MKQLIALYYYIGKEIKRRRVAKGMSQQELADGMGVGRTTIVHWETGAHKLGVEDLYYLAILFECKPTDFLPPPSDTILMTNEEAYQLFLAKQGE